MYVKEITSIDNFRNLSGLDFVFDKELNFIIGENNTGKTNIIELIDIIFSKGKFSKPDFNDTTKQINATIKIVVTDDEIGFFEDFFDPEEENQLTISIIQENYDERIVYICGSNEIKHSIIKKLNTFYYHSQRTPYKEISFSKETGNGAVLNYFVTKSLEKRNYNLNSFLDSTKLNELMQDINIYINKIGLLMKDSIKSYVSEEPQNYISRLLEIGDSEEVSLSDLGDGVQYAFNILLSILDEILDKKKTYSSVRFDEMLVCKNEKKYYPMIIILDEPEIHQHPARQRLIIKKIKEIIENKNNDFLDILKDLFEIDGIIGQMFVVTHSPNVLSDDYKQFIRLYKEDVNMKCICGQRINIEDNNLKHLFSMFDEIKYSFFCHSVLLVEGDTEKGSFPLIAKKQDIDLDYYSSNVVGMGGADNVNSLIDIYKEFGIDVYAYLDRDKYNQYSSNPLIMFTDKKDFEEEILSVMSYEEKMKALNILNKSKSIINELKRVEPSFSSAEYNRNFYVPILNDEQKREIDTILSQKVLGEMKKNKNQVSSYRIVDMMSNYPQTIINFVKKAKGN